LFCKVQMGSRTATDGVTVRQGHHGDVGANFADVILPGAAYTEKDAHYVNVEGRPQQTRAVVAPPANAREDWKIIRALSEVLGFTLPYDDARAVYARLVDVAPHFAHVGHVQPSTVGALGLRALVAAGAAAGPAQRTALAQPFALPIRDYYLTDTISRASQTMAKCSATFTHGKRDESPQAAASL
jgi:NADH dehydrogenase (ubiquinone) Fe-S protein 1